MTHNTQLDEFEPEDLTQPTPEEHNEAMDRVYAALGSQGIRDMHTAFWHGWNRGYNKGKAQETVL